MKCIGRIEKSIVNQFVVSSKSTGMAKRFATTCLAVSLGVFAFAAQPAAAEESRLGGYALEDQSMLGRYGDMNDEWIATSSNVDISRAELSADKKKKMHKKDHRLGAYSAQDNAMLGRYGDKNDE